jgi:hypothetical protein
MESQIPKLRILPVDVNIEINLSVVPFGTLRTNEDYDVALPDQPEDVYDLPIYPYIFPSETGFAAQKASTTADPLIIG